MDQPRHKGGEKKKNKNPGSTGPQTTSEWRSESSNPLLILGCGLWRSKVCFFLGLANLQNPHSQCRIVRFSSSTTFTIMSNLDRCDRQTGSQKKLVEPQFACLTSCGMFGNVRDAPWWTNCNGNQVGTPRHIINQVRTANWFYGVTSEKRHLDNTTDITTFGWGLCCYIHTNYLLVV